MTGWEEIAENAKILVIDDDRVSIHVITRMLEDAGYKHIWSSQDPSGGFELFREIQPDLVLIDLHMQPMNGLELVRQIQHELPASSYVPMVVITADSSEEAKLNALLLGAKDFITKPVDRVETMLRVRIWLETRFRFLEMERMIERLKGPYGSGSPTRYE